MILRRLLRRNLSAWQIAGYSAATFIGLIIVAVAAQFYADASGALNRDSQGDISMLSQRNIVLTKPVGLGATLSGKAPSFSAGEIADIEAQPWVAGVAPFRAADFGIHASVDMAGRRLQTALFFESVPDRVLDPALASLPEWQFDPAHPAVPIILSKDYLALYNFGFASSGRMPVVSESMISGIPLTITLSGRGLHESLPGRIVGFSSRLNTVAVPESFMEWAHGRYGRDEASGSPSRVIVEVSDPASPAVDRYLTDKGYERADDDADLGRAAFMLRLVASVVCGVGGLITFLAIAILILSLYLLVQKNRAVIHGLLMLGYTPRTVARYYIRLVVIINSVVAALAVCATIALRGLWMKQLGDAGVDGAGLWAAICVPCALMAVVTFINFCVIRRLVSRCFRV